MVLSNLHQIEKFQFFNGASEKLKREVVKVGNVIDFQKDSCIFAKSARMGFVAFLLEGRVRVHLDGNSGREITLYHVNPGEMCPTNIMYSLLDKNSPARAVAVSPGRAIAVSSNIFRKWMNEQPSVRLAIVDTISSRFIDMMTLVEEITFHKLDRRLAAYIENEFARSSVVPPIINLTQEQIAYELGSVREVVSRLLSEFEHLGIIQRSRRRLTLLDAHLLNEIAQPN